MGVYMTTEGLALIIIALCVGAIIGASLFAGVALKKKWNVPQVLQTADSALGVADIVSDALKPVLPPSVSTITDKVIEYAKTAVTGAEQLYHIGTIQGDQRKEEALAFVENALKVEKIEITDDMRKVIDMAVEAAVMSLGHKTDTSAPVISA